MTTFTTWIPTVEEFRAWLDTFGPEQVVGTSQRRRDCPVARAVSARGGSDVSVDRFRTEVNGGLVQNPLWVWAFIDRIDSEHPVPEPVTAAECRRALAVAQGWGPECTHGRP